MSVRVDPPNVDANLIAQINHPAGRLALAERLGESDPTPDFRMAQPLARALGVELSRDARGQGKATLERDVAVDRVIRDLPAAAQDALRNAHRRVDRLIFQSMAWAVTSVGFTALTGAALTQLGLPSNGAELLLVGASTSGAVGHGWAAAMDYRNYSGAKVEAGGWRALNEGIRAAFA